MILPHDRQIAAWLADGPHEGPPESLARALAATHRTRRRPRWTFPGRWIPMQLSLARTWSPHPIVTVVTLALLLVIVAAGALFIGRLQSPPFRNGAVVPFLGVGLWPLLQLALLTPLSLALARWVARRWGGPS